MREEIQNILWENLSVWNEDEIQESLDKITALIERESGVEKSIDDVIELVKIDQSDKDIIFQYNTQGVIDILNAMKNRFNPPKSEEV